MRLGSGLAKAVAWAGDFSSDSTPSLETSIYCECSLKKKKKKKKKDKITKKKKKIRIITGEQ